MYSQCIIRFLSVAVICLLFTSSAYAACVNPQGVEGEQVYNSTYKTMQFCDGTRWWPMKGGGGSGGSLVFDECQPGEAIIYNSTSGRAECPFDRVPDAFVFTDQTGVELSTLTMSDILQIVNMDNGVAISISGTGTPQYRICADATCSGAPAYGSTAGTINNGDYLQLRLTSNAAWVTANSATVNVGTASDIWDVTTRPDCTIGSTTWNTGGSYVFTMPVGCGSVTVKVWGAGGAGGLNRQAGGGGGNGGDGGGGGYATSAWSIGEGTNLNVYVGGGGVCQGPSGTSGGTSKAGYTGGFGGSTCSDVSNGRSGGGGASIVDDGASLLIVAGGGGGGGNDAYAPWNTSGGHGGAGGGEAGTQGASSGGGGGNGTTGGAAGASPSGCAAGASFATSGQNASVGVGGRGGGGIYADTFCGGGGGGGYAGGGGGGGGAYGLATSTTFCVVNGGGGGAGGTSYGDTVLIGNRKIPGNSGEAGANAAGGLGAQEGSGENQCGVNGADGLVIISWGI